MEKTVPARRKRVSATEKRADLGLEGWVDIFCRLYAMYDSPTEAYMQARKTVGKEVTKNTAVNTVGKLLRQEAVKERIRHYRREVSASTADIRDMIMSKVPMSVRELVHIIQIDWCYDKEGNLLIDDNGRLIRSTIKATVLREKLNAIRILLGMAGFSEVKKIELSQVERLEIALSQCDETELARIAETGEVPDVVRKRMEGIRMGDV